MNACDGARPTWSNGTGIATDPDLSADDGPAWLACNRSAAHPTYPNATATTWWLVFGFGSEVEFDLVGLFGTNLDVVDPDAGVDVVVEIADDLAFTTNLLTIASWTQFGARHLRLLTDRITGTGFLRVGLTAALAFIPRIGECWVGRRRQLRGFVRTGRDPDGLSSKQASSSTESSVQGAEPQAIGRRDLPMALRLIESAPLLSDTASIRRWWKEIDCGAAPFIWCRNPSTNPHAAIIATTSATVLDLPRTEGQFHRSFAQPWLELAPFLSGES